MNKNTIKKLISGDSESFIAELQKNISETFAGNRLISESLKQKNRCKNVSKAVRNYIADSHDISENSVSEIEEKLSGIKSMIKDNVSDEVFKNVCESIDGVSEMLSEKPKSAKVQKCESFESRFQRYIR